MGRIILVPTSHVAEESVMAVREAVAREKPDCIAVELDLNRFYSMRKQSSHRDVIKSLGIGTFLIYFMMKKLQDWIGKKVGILPGSEMMEAVRLGESYGLTIAFIDRDIRITFLRLKKVSAGEKAKLVWFLLKGATIGFLASKVKKQNLIDLRKFPPKKIINEALCLIKKQFPQLYEVLISERDMHMAKKLKELSGRFETTVAVVGAGHYDGIRKLLETKTLKPQN